MIKMKYDKKFCGGIDPVGIVITTKKDLLRLLEKINLPKKEISKCTNKMNNYVTYCYYSEKTKFCCWIERKTERTYMYNEPFAYDESLCD